MVKVKVVNKESERWEDYGVVHPRDWNAVSVWVPVKFGKTEMLMYRGNLIAL